MAVSAEDLDVLNTASQRLAGMLSPEAGREVLQQGIELLAELIGARYAAIGLVDESGVPVDFVYTGIDSGAAAGIGRLPRGDGLLGTVVDRHAALRVDELGADPRAAGFPAGHPPMSSLLAVPVVHQDRVFGRVYLCDKRDGRPFTARDEQLAGQFATTLGLVLSHKYLSERHRAHRELAEAFAGAWAGLMGEALLQKAVAALLENLDVDLAFVGEIDPAAPDSVNMRAICNRRGPGTPVTYRLSGSPCEGVVQSKAYCVVAADVAHRYPADKALAALGAQSYAGVPLLDNKGEVIGLMAVIGTRPLDDDALPRWLLGFLADRIAAELQLMRTGDALERHSESLLLAETAERRFETITRISPVGILRTDARGRCVYTNARWQEITGLSDAEARDHGWTRALHPEDRERVLAEWQASFLAGRPFQTECRFLRPDGSVRWIYGQSTLERVAGGTIGCVATVTDITALRAAEERAALQALLLDQVPSAVFATDAGMRITYWNRHAETLYQWRADEVAGRPMDEVKAPLKPDVRTQVIFDTVDAEGRWEGECEVTRKDGAAFPAHVVLSCLRTPEGTLQGYLGVAIDVTERRAAQAERIQLSRAIEQTTDSVMITDARGVIEYVNRAFEIVTGYTREEAIGATPKLVKSGRHDAAFYRRLWQRISSGEAFFDVLINRKKNGDIYYEEKSITPLTDESGRITHFVSTGRDITERVHAEEQLSHLAYYDTLTNLPNRRLLADRLRQQMIETRRHGRLLAVIFLDLDRFKDINDTLGHDVGDALLQAVARRLTETLRDDDTVARMSGDEFVILLYDVACTDDVTSVTRKIQCSFDQPLRFAGRELFVTPSMGVTIYPQDDSSPEDLLKHADAAMYHAKERGRGSFHFYSEELNRRATLRFELENAMRHALEKDEFRIHYQAQVDPHSGRIVGMEALARWERPGIGLVSPLDFIPLAEETGFIVPLGEWILRTACAQMVQWQRAGHPGLRLAVNISARQLQHPDFVQSVAQALNDTGLEAASLDLELTESLLMENLNEAAEVLQDLHGLGVKFCLDDFGTGYSSLSYLKRFPIAFLKIDRSFVRDILEDPNDRAIVEAVIAMGQRLGIELIAEGIETAEQLELFRTLNCHCIQGFYCSKPLPAAEVEGLLRTGPACRHAPPPQTAG